MLLVTGIAQAIRMSIDGTFRFDEYIMLMMMLLIMASITSSITLPLVFKLGVEKGRIANYIVLGIVCAGSVIASGLFIKDMQTQIKLNGVLPIICFVGVGIYVLSWYLSIVFYQKREII